MPAPALVMSGLVDPVALLCAPAAGTVYVAQRDGHVLSVDVGAATASPLVDVGSGISNFDVTADGTLLYLVGSALGVWEVDLKSGAGRRFARRLNRPSAICIDHATGHLLVAEGRTPGRLLRFTTEPPGVKTDGRGLRRPQGMVLETATNRVLVVEAVAGGRLVAAGGDVPIPLAEGLGMPVDLAWHDEAGGRLLIADSAGGRVLELDLAFPATPKVLFDGLDKVWGARMLSVDKVLIGAADGLWLGDLTLAARLPVELRVPPDKLFVSGWLRVPVIINDPGVAFGDLDFRVQPDNVGAMVSYSRDNSFNAGAPEIMLIAGAVGGPHWLTADHRLTGAPLAKVPFTVLGEWADDSVGPSFTTVGSVESGPTGSTWGGPDAGDFTVPQNVRPQKALGTRRVGVVLVETNDAQYPTDTPGDPAFTNIRNTVQTDVNTAARYYSEASNGLFNLDVVGIVGPLRMPGNFSQYFTVNPNNQWLFNAATPAAVVAQIVRAELLDLTGVDSLVLVFRSVAPTPTMAVQFAWPRASLGSQTHTVGVSTVGGFSRTISRGLGVVFMPQDWATLPGSGRQFSETLAHELGHNLELGDTYYTLRPGDPGYDADIDNREAGFIAGNSWELMTSELGFPLPSAAHRLMLGWLDPTRVFLCNFGTKGRLETSVTLHAAGAPGPVPPGRSAAVEVRIEDGKNLYFEYRPNIPGRLVDSVPPEASTVVATLAEFRLSRPATTPGVLLVPEDSDTVVDNGAFAIGEDYRDKDTSTPGFDNEFIMDVLATTADSATIRIRYAAGDKPDPAITPWAPSTNWQSPDIEVINARSTADSIYRNVPWEGHDNTMIARVTNLGNLPASGVEVSFFAKDFTFGEGAEIALGRETKDVPPGPPVTFTAPLPWRPPTVRFPFGPLSFDQHACLVARIPPFLDPVSHVLEVTPENNEAHSNYTWTASTTASPASREVIVVNAENPLPRAATVHFTVHQPHPLFRVYLEHRYLRLQPGERRSVLVMTESLLGDERFASLAREILDQRQRIATTLRLSALGDTGENCTQQVLGGVSVLVIAGGSTSFTRFETDGETASGTILDSATQNGVSGKVLVSIRPLDPSIARSEIVRETEARDGEFYVGLEAPPDSLIQGHYLGHVHAAPCDSKDVRV